MLVWVVYSFLEERLLGGKVIWFIVKVRKGKRLSFGSF